MKFIGIDPGVSRCGVWDDNNPYSVPLWELFTGLLADYEAAREYGGLTVIVENSNLTKGNWHGPTARGGVGKNKAVSQIIVNFLKEKGIPYMEIPPAGYSVMAEKKNIHIFHADSGYTKQTNEHERAAFFIMKAGRSRWVLERKKRVNQGG